MKLLLAVIKQLSGQKINFHKSEILCYGEPAKFQERYMQIYRCDIRGFRYLGIPLHHRKLVNSEWRMIEERFERKLNCWKVKHLSYGGCLTLLNYVPSNLPIFMMSFFEIPKRVLIKLDFYRSRFYWQGGKDKKKYRLVS